MKEKRIIKGSTIALTFETGFVGMAFEQVEGNMAQHRQVFGRVIQSDTGSILSKSGIKGPVDGVFNSPVSAGSVKNTLGIGRQAGQEIGRFELNTASQRLVRPPYYNALSQADPAAVNDAISPFSENRGSECLRRKSANQH